MVHAFLAAAIIVAGCHQSPPLADAQSTIVPDAHAAALARRLAGCYRLDDGPWRADSVRAGDISTSITPLFFELTGQVLPGFDSLQSGDHPMFVVRDSADQRAGFPFEYWQAMSANTDTIRISYPMPLAGVALRLGPIGKDLVGTATAFTDAVREGQPGEVSRPVRAASSLPQEIARSEAGTPKPARAKLM